MYSPLSLAFLKRIFGILLLLADFLQNKRSKKFLNIHRKTPLLESIFKVPDWVPIW